MNILVVLFGGEYGEDPLNLGMSSHIYTFQFSIIGCFFSNHITNISESKVANVLTHFRITCNNRIFWKLFWQGYRGDGIFIPIE